MDLRADRRVRRRPFLPRRGPDIRPTLPRLLIAIAALAGCRSVGNGPSRGCPTTIDQIGCAATFDQQAQQSFMCAGVPGCCDQGGTCGPYRVWRTMMLEAGGLSCVYDGTGQQLLAGTVCRDRLAFCGGSEFCAMAGDATALDPTAACDVLSLPAICPAGDAGAD